MDIEKQKIINEIEELAKIAAETFYYYEDRKDAKDGNFYKGKNEIGGQCSDYALKFILLWNEKKPRNSAEIVVANQDTVVSGSYKVIKKLTDEEKINAEPSIPKWMKFDKSGYIPNIKINGIESIVFYHSDPKIGFYQLVLSKPYEVIQHFGIDMANKGPHVWAKVGDIAVDPCWADTMENTPFIGKDVIS